MGVKGKIPFVGGNSAVFETYIEFLQCGNNAAGTSCACSSFGYVHVLRILVIFRGFRRTVCESGLAGTTAIPGSLLILLWILPVLL